MLLRLFPVLCALIGVALYLYARASRRARLVERMQYEVRRKNIQPQTRGWQHHNALRRLMAMLHHLGHRAPLFNAAQRLEISHKLVRAGFRGPKALLLVIALSLISSFALLALVIVLFWPLLADQSLYSVLLCLLALYLGTLLPRIVLDRLVARRQHIIQQSLPDALDLLVICTNSGLGLNSAIQRVAEEMALVCPVLADELRLTSGELQISNDTEAVLNRLVKRTGLESVKTLVNTLLQSRQYGTAITQALRILARAERTTRMMRLEEAAAKLAVKITLPMMLFILPTVLIVAAGPAVLGIIEFFATQY
ncbi:type II secretion system F family protein [Brenneria izbisi]|uniref:Type II secretion system F family protein n=1 Tax=Brenneria izbisi TaxID=2939450 RepID=A0AA41Y114_9GAMM|nr:type II secretion system F family protein [Brenneria izbisi]MCV9878712.1 type II secretion system F family protein [Brenneria izbisi]MCV9882105.1 type II secretion system F family protein [Brenneria izbisi]